MVFGLLILPVNLFLEWEETQAVLKFLKKEWIIIVRRMCHMVKSDQNGIIPKLRQAGEGFSFICQLNMKIPMQGIRCFIYSMVVEKMNVDGPYKGGRILLWIT